MDAWPIDSTKRSRFGQTGSCGSKRRKCCHSVYATGAIAMGVPGCPESAAWTASMARVRMVLILMRSIDSNDGETGEEVLIQGPFMAVTMLSALGTARDPLIPESLWARDQ